MPKALAPILHQTLKDHHRVPVAYFDGKYEIYIQDNYIRIFDDNDLPDVIKAKLTMIRAQTQDPPSPEPILIARAYEHPKDSNMLEIGWVVCEGLYVVVIPTKDLTYMRKGTYPKGARCYAGFIISNDIPTHRNLEDFDPRMPFNYISTVGRFSGNT